MGAVSANDWHGIWLGLPIGYLLGAYIQLKGNLAELQHELKTIRTNLIESRVEVAAVIKDRDEESDTPTLVSDELEEEEEIDNIDGFGLFDDNGDY